MATQTLLQKKAKNMLVSVDGEVGAGITAKDIVLAIIGRIGTAGGTGCTIEFGGDAIRALSMEGRMTVCNMSIEAGARAGMIGVDQTTIEYLRGRPFSPSGDMLAAAEAAWLELKSDDGAHFDEVYMALEPATAMTDITLDRVFIGSCTNSRIEDLRAAAAVVGDRRVASSIKQALVVPGSGLVKCHFVDVRSF